jgi:2-polyprenyl-3-methyl-5-hydroxy-6-metoxy-1,4-benzoquinol methylase
LSPRSDPLTAATWDDAKAIIGTAHVTLGATASQQWLHAPEHLAFVLARYRAAAALIGNAQRVIEFGCGEGIGARILAKGRTSYLGIDSDFEAYCCADGHHHDAPAINFWHLDVLQPFERSKRTDAVVALDVIEHIQPDDERRFLDNSVNLLHDHGACVLGTPNARFDDLASPQSQAGHVNTYTHERLHALMSRYFYVVQSFGLQDTSLHLGHPDARHYLLMCGIGPR